MKIVLTSCLLLVAQVCAFAPVTQRTVVSRALMMSEEPTREPTPPPPPSDSKVQGGALVPIKEETVEFTAGILGGIAGFALGGPLFGLIGAAAANLASKKDGDVTEVIQGVSKSGIQVYNYFVTLDQKYEVLNKAKSSLQSALDRLKEQEVIDKEAVAKVEAALASTNAKIKEVNEEYDLVGGGITALGVVGDLVDKAVTRANELNAEYKLTEKAKQAIANAIEKARSGTTKA